MSLVVARYALHDEPDQVTFWRDVAPSERVAAVEVLRRRVIGGGDEPRPRLQRVCRVVHR